jgi:ABC-type branched-subunit amino acid transport system substrate-binding protein
MQDRDFVRAKTYFILTGRVADWVNIYEPVFQANGWRRGAVVKFTSGFSQTISEEMRRLFSTRPREFLGEFEYQDLRFTEASLIALKLGRLNPDVVYVDGQPEGLANFLRRRAQLKLQSIPVVGHSAFDTALTQKLITVEEAQNLYFLRREAADASFVERFQGKFKRAPVLSADLGYYAVYMAVQALAAPDPLEALRRGMNVKGKDFAFDKDQVASGVRQEVYRVSDSGEVVRVNTVEASS